MRGERGGGRGTTPQEELKSDSTAALIVKCITIMEERYQVLDNRLDEMNGRLEGLNKQRSTSQARGVQKDITSRQRHGTSIDGVIGNIPQGIGGTRTLQGEEKQGIGHQEEEQDQVPAIVTRRSCSRCSTFGPFQDIVPRFVPAATRSSA